MRKRMKIMFDTATAKGRETIVYAYNLIDAWNIMFENYGACKIRKAEEEFEEEITEILPF